MISALLGDITRLDFDIVVVGVNENYEPINEISRTIHEKDKEQLQSICTKLGKGKLGQAKITDIQTDRYKKIIHVVPPVYIDGTHRESELLKATYWNSMVLAFDYLEQAKQKRVTLAFSSLNVEGYRYPSEQFAKIAVETIRAIYLRYQETKCIDVVFVCDHSEDYANIKKELRKR